MTVKPFSQKSRPPPEISRLDIPLCLCYDGIIFAGALQDHRQINKKERLPCSPHPTSAPVGMPASRTARATGYGEVHGLENRGTEPVALIALIVGE